MFAQDLTGFSSLQRPRKSIIYISAFYNVYSSANIVLLILDRNMDFVSMLAHEWRYKLLYLTV